MNYKEIETENFDGTKSKHIIIDNGDESFKSFPADESNPEYVAFLEALEGKEPNLPEVIETPETSEAK
jgi:hypothetical protein